MNKGYLLLVLLLSNILFSQTIDLTPNTCFFSPSGTLELQEVSTVTDAYNRNKHYERIGEWRVANDTIVWGIKNMQAGTLTVELFAGINANENNSEVTLFVDDQQQDLTVTATPTIQTPQSQGSVNFNINSSGTHIVKIKIKNQQTTENFGEIQKLVLSGTAINNANVWLRRWRPAAMHGTFTPANSETNPTITVFNLNVTSHDYSSYQVIMTEFGYVGASTPPKNVQPQGVHNLNFSLWSYGANAPIPPHYQLSHLIAVGGNGNGFGRYGHEGTGVKPRGFDPFNNSSNYDFTVAVRKQPGTVYNTFWCYYLDPTTSHWKLYGAGKKYNANQNIQYLSPTSGFLEVIGAPHKARKGHNEYQVEYKGWRRQEDDTWNTISKLDAWYTGLTNISYKNWSQNNNGDGFVFTSGGFRDSPPDPGIITLANPPALPLFLQGSYIDELYQMPADFSTLTPENITPNSATLKFDIQNIGTNPEIKLYYGTQYGLTEGINKDNIIDPVWENEQDVPLSALNNTILSVPVSNLTPNTQYHYRLRIKNDEGITWSFDAETFTTTNTTLSITNIEQNNTGLIVYPNPTTGLLNIATEERDIKNIKFYNLTGQLILSIQNKNTIDIHQLEKGIYLMKLQLRNTTKTIKVIKR